VKAAEGGDTHHLPPRPEDGLKQALRQASGPHALL
jgi:hypothetical protein